MQQEHPLTPTLSPATGERENIRASKRDSLNGERFQCRMNRFPLPSPARGEGQGEGSSSYPRHSDQIPTDAQSSPRTARLLRKRPTWAEKLLWRWLRGRRFSGYKFRRQHPFGPYVLDFFCCESRLDIELDGGGHNDRSQEIEDDKRDRFLQAHGVRVLRFRNRALIENRDGVRTMIWEALQQSPCSSGKSDQTVTARETAPLTPSLSPQGGERVKSAIRKHESSAGKIDARHDSSALSPSDKRKDRVTNGGLKRDTRSISLSPSDGERARVRGRNDQTVTAKSS